MKPIVLILLVVLSSIQSTAQTRRPKKGTILGQPPPTWRFLTPETFEEDVVVFRRKLSFMVNLSKSADGMPAPIRAALVFPADEIVGSAATSVELTNIQLVDKNRLRVSLSREEFVQLSGAHGFEIAQIEVTQGKKHLLAIDRKGPKILIDGEFSTSCRRPIYLSDYHDTLDTKDACTKNAVNEIMEKTNAIFAVVSNGGTTIKEPLYDLGFKHHNRFIVIDNEGSYGEKAGTIYRSLWATNACIVGFFGDSGDKEGVAAKELGIPFLAVNQKDSTTLVPYTEKNAHVTTCTLKRSRYAYVMPPGFVSCPAHQEKSDYHGRVTCTKSASRDGRASGISRTQTWKYEDRFQTASQQCHSDETASDVLPPGEGCADKSVYEVSESEQCQPEYVKETKIQDVARVREISKPSIDINEYPSGSLYTHNWCEIRDRILGKKEAAP
jgi:hypothetical protein